MLVAHRSQVHAVPDDLPDGAAMLIEPLACALHGVERGLSATRDSTSVGAVLVAGAGTLGLLTILALRLLGWEGEIIAVGRHSHQRDRALALGASLAVSPDMAISAARRLSRSTRLDPSRGSPFLLGGVDVAFECAGTPSALDLAMRTTRGGGRVVLVGMPAAGVDLAPVWFRELEVIGAYAASGGFQAALNFSSRVADQLDGLVSATYPLVRWREAIDHALDAGRLGDARIAFDPRAD